MKITKQNIITLLAFTGSLALSSLSQAAGVKSMSFEVFKNEEGNKRWEISVVCDDNPQSRFMHRSVDAEQWCADGESNLCDVDKATLAATMCGGVIGAGTTKPADTATVNSPDKAALLKEKIQVEEELIKIQQLKLELRRREIELQKQEMELSSKS